MSTAENFTDIDPKEKVAALTASQVAGGIPIPPIRLLQVMSPEDWELFTEEWLSFHKNNGTYKSIKKYSGSGDLGLDLVAFTTDGGFEEPWDSYQCKHYDHALFPNDIYGEVAKIIYHSFNRTPPFNQACRTPRKHVFVCPNGVGITVGRWLKDPTSFKNAVKEKWETNCVPQIGKNIKASLEDEILEYFESFDFTIFEDRTSVELIEEHSQTIFHAARFGGGLPPRAEPEAPPTEPAESENLYLRKLLDAYSDHLGYAARNTEELTSHLINHYNRQRILFYSAESLRNFARDRTPAQTFDSLKNDVYNGVIDVCEATYQDALQCLRSTISRAAVVDISGNALVGVTSVADKQGICHQLANDDRLTWVKDND